MSRNQEQTKTDAILASIYDSPFPKESEEEVILEEKKQTSSTTDSNEGKLKLFLGGLYFQTERMFKVR